MKTIISLFLIFSFSIADDIKKTDEDLSKLTTEELVAKILELEKRDNEAEERVIKARAKTQELKEVGKTLDKLANMIGVEDK